MRKILFMTTMLLTFGAVNAQIGDCSQKGGYVELYNSNGKYMTRFSISSNAQLNGCTSSMVVVTSGSYVEIYDENGKYKTRFSISTSAYVKNVTGNNIFIKNGSYVETYNSEGKYVTRRSE
jgi:roadblock/LC7 domain-containing protein